MKRFWFPTITAIFLSSASFAETPSEPDGADLIEQGMQLLFKELFSQIDPALKDFQALSDDLGPKFMELFELVDDFRNYEVPEKLPNGDILIRRIRPLKEGEIDL